MGPLGNRCPFPEPYLAYLLGSPVKEPSLQAPLIEIHHFYGPPSFIFQHPWYTIPLPGSPVGPLQREMPVSRAFLYTSSRVPSKTAPPYRFSSQSSHRDAPPLEPPSSISQKERVGTTCLCSYITPEHHAKRAYDT